MLSAKQRERDSPLLPHTVLQQLSLVEGILQEGDLPPSPPLTAATFAACVPAKAGKRRTWLGSPCAEGPGTAAGPPLPAGGHPQPRWTGKVCSAQALGGADVCPSVLGLALLPGTADVFWRQRYQQAERCPAVWGILVVVPDLPLTHRFLN